MQFPKSSLFRSFAPFLFSVLFVSSEQAAWADDAKRTSPQPNSLCDHFYNQSPDLHPVTGLIATIRPDWSVTDAKVVKSSGFPDLDRSAIDCVEATKIAPATIDGKPVEITWAFNLNWNTYEGHSYAVVPRSHGGMSYYPASAVHAHTEGDTVLSFHIMPDGTVRKPVVLQSSGNEDLDAAAQAQALEWRYQPATLNGQPVEFEWQSRVVWRLNG